MFEIEDGFFKTLYPNFCFLDKKPTKGGKETTQSLQAKKDQLDKEKDDLLKRIDKAEKDASSITRF